MSVSLIIISQLTVLTLTSTRSPDCSSSGFIIPIIRIWNRPQPHSSRRSLALLLRNEEDETLTTARNRMLRKKLLTEREIEMLVIIFVHPKLFKLLNYARTKNMQTCHVCQLYDIYRAHEYESIVRILYNFILISADTIVSYIRDICACRYLRIY